MTELLLLDSTFSAPDIRAGQRFVTEPTSILRWLWWLLRTISPETSKTYSVGRKIQFPNLKHDISFDSYQWLQFYYVCKCMWIGPILKEINTSGADRCLSDRTVFLLRVMNEI